MKTECIEYTHQGTVLEAFVAFDETKGKTPAVLIFHAWRGRDDFVCEKAKWIASLGYVGIALDLYGKGVLGESVEENGKLMQPFIDDRTFLLSRIEEGISAVQNHSAIEEGKMSAMGFCFGGLCALDLARSGAPLQGAISVHGLLNPPGYSIKPQSKILALHGHDDPMVPPEQVLAFEKEMTEAKVDWQMHIFGKTMHAFTNPAVNDPTLGTVYSQSAERRSLFAIEHFFKECYTIYQQ